MYQTALRLVDLRIVIRGTGLRAPSHPPPSNKTEHKKAVTDEHYKFISQTHSEKKKVGAKSVGNPTKSVT